MNIDQQLEELSNLHYPAQVDVTEAVLAQIAGQPRLQPVRCMTLRRNVSMAAAAVVLVLVGVSVYLSHTRTYDLDGLGSMITQVNDYSTWNIVEQAALDPYAIIYEE